MDADTRLMNSSMLVGPCLEQQVLSSLKHLTNLGLIAVLKLFGSRYACFCLFVWFNHWQNLIYNVFCQTGALLLDGNTLNYFGKNIPINLIFAVVAEVVLVGGAEYYRIINGLVTKNSSSAKY